MKVRVAVSPDADDLFMVRGLMLGAVDPRGLTFSFTTADTEALNRGAAGPDAPDVSAISVAWYPSLAAEWALLPHGGSVGRGYGPVLIARAPCAPAELRGARIAVPGLRTTAYTVLRLVLGEFTPVVVPIVPPEAVFERLRAGEFDAALLIHEGRLTYAAEGFHLVLDTGVAWQGQTGLPLPLGANAIRRALGPEVIARASAALRDSIAHGLAHRAEAIAWLLKRGGPLQTAEAVDRYLALYANEDTLDYGEDGRAGVQRLLSWGAAAGLLPPCPPVDWAP
jgi:1,4-dihydroxy-6-naphthoate synthase